MMSESPFIDFPILTTEHLILRSITPSDAPALFRILSNPQGMVHHAHAPYQSLDAVQRLIQYTREYYEEGEGLWWGVQHKNAPTLIGMCAFFPFSFGYALAQLSGEFDADMLGTNLILEAVQSVVDYGFQRLEMHRIEAITDDTNRRFKDVLLNLGFQYEANLRERLHIDGKFYDEHYYGLLKTDWEQQ